MAGKSAGGIRKPYAGDRRSLVIALDVGTTFSGVSYAFLNPGEVPKIHGVTRYPGQEHVTGNTKIPSILFYDHDGTVKAAGAEAESGQVEDSADEEGWTKVELFKLRLRPKQMELDMNGMKMTPLPAKKSSEMVFGDFLRYLFSCSQKFIEDTHANGKNLWKAVEKDIHFVLSHPNGWEGAQQSRMRRAAIFGGLVSDTDDGKSRIRFVTEGEASMHACILSGLAADVLATGNGFIVADAGGGTLDISSYVLKGTYPLVIEEVAPPDCLFAGSVFVSRRARVFLEAKLKGSKYGSADALDHITRRFDETTKRLFRDKGDPQYIHFGSPLDKDLKVGIRGGQLKLTGTEVAELFEPSIEAVVSSIIKQFEASRGVVKAVWLVGGFAASSWLFTQLQSRLSHLNIAVNRPDTQTSKAVADGAVGFFCDHHVSARISRFMYGVEYLREINLNDQEHVDRKNRMLRLPSGPQYLPDAFDCILKKNVRVKESAVFSRKYYTEVTKLAALSVFEIEIWCYRGGEEIPKWIDRTSQHFGSLCFVRADLSKLTNAAEPQKGPKGNTYWTVAFSIEIHFGLTEFKARMKYTEDGVVKYGPASIIFNEKGIRSDEDDRTSIPDDENVEKPQARQTSKAPKLSTPSSSSMSSSTNSDATTVEPLMVDVPLAPKSALSKGKKKDTKKATSPLSSPLASRAGSQHGAERSLDTAALGIMSSIPSRTPSVSFDIPELNESPPAPAPAPSQPDISSLAPPPAPAPALSTSGSGQSNVLSPTDTLVDTPKSPVIETAASVKDAPPEPEIKEPESTMSKDVPAAHVPASDAGNAGLAFASKFGLKGKKAGSPAPSMAKSLSSSSKKSKSGNPWGAKAIEPSTETNTPSPPTDEGPALESNVAASASAPDVVVPEVQPAAEVTAVTVPGVEAKAEDAAIAPAANDVKADENPSLDAALEPTPAVLSESNPWEFPAASAEAKATETTSSSEPLAADPSATAGVTESGGSPAAAATDEVKPAETTVSASDKPDGGASDAPPAGKAAEEVTTDAAKEESGTDGGEKPVAPPESDATPATAELPTEENKEDVQAGASVDAPIDPLSADDKKEEKGNAEDTNAAKDEDKEEESAALPTGNNNKGGGKGGGKNKKKKGKK